MMNIQIGFYAGALRGFNPSVRDRAGIATVTSPHLGPGFALISLF